MEKRQEAGKLRRNVQKKAEGRNKISLFLILFLLLSLFLFPFLFPSRFLPPVSPDTGAGESSLILPSLPYGIRRRPTLPGRFQPSTISAERLNFCVRYGNRWIPLAIVTGNSADALPHPHNCTQRVDLNVSASLTPAPLPSRALPPLLRSRAPASLLPFSSASRYSASSLRLSPRPISISKLHTLPHFHR